MVLGQAEPATHGAYNYNALLEQTCCTVELTEELKSISRAHPRLHQRSNNDDFSANH
jgi:hypothetical protein